MLTLLLGRCRPIETRGWLIWLAASLPLLALRLWLAMPFWKSGLTKWSTFPSQLSGSAKYLFQNEFKLHLLVATIDMPFPILMATLAGWAELLFPVLLVIGLTSRFAALGILGLTLVIQLVFPSAYLIHGSWALAALLLLVMGPGLLSLDSLLRRLLRLSVGGGRAA